MTPATHEKVRRYDQAFGDLHWSEVRNFPISDEAVRALQYMQAVESHTVVYLRTLLSTRAVDDAEISVFLARWFHEETLHGLALGEFLAIYGAPVEAEPYSSRSISEKLRDAGTWLLSRCRSDFVGVHMLWGAINELTTLTGYRRLTRLEPHPILRELLARIIRDEARHFSFYADQARRRLAEPRSAALARALVERFWAPVGSGVRTPEELRFLAGYLFGGSRGRAAMRRVDQTIRSIPGMTGIALLESWVDRSVPLA